MRFPIRTKDSYIQGDLEYGSNNHCVILMHGYEANRNGASATFMAEHLRDLGIDSYRFDLPGCGDDTLSISDCTINQSMSYLETILKHFRRARSPYEQFSLFATSGSGPIALAAAKISDFTKIGLQAPASFEYLRSVKEKCRLEGITSQDEVYNIPVGGKVVQVAARLIDHEANWTPNISIQSTPIMIVHGERDRIIPVTYSMQLENRNENVTLHISPGARHSCAQPDRKDYAASVLAPWFAKKK